MMAAKSKSKGNQRQEKVKVRLEHICYICCIPKSGANRAIEHAKKIHGYDIPIRTIGINRPPHRGYEYVVNKRSNWTEVEYACPCCWYHCSTDDLEAFNEHMRRVHQPIMVEIKDNRGYCFLGDAIDENDHTDDSNSCGSIESSINDGGDNNNQNYLVGSIVQTIDELTTFFRAFFGPVVVTADTDDEVITEVYATPDTQITMENVLEDLVC